MVVRTRSVTMAMSESKVARLSLRSTQVSAKRLINSFIAIIIWGSIYSTSFNDKEAKLNWQLAPIVRTKVLSLTRAWP
ncbi:hypothetical protein GQ53DRAFT_127427 [Thozetella sp. PMI_491]|nr:hypothetical protein GQ53DRAFT_127427 [Thozetella sp. PMI_491]